MHRTRVHLGFNYSRLEIYVLTSLQISLKISFSITEESYLRAQFLVCLLYPLLFLS